MSGYVGLNQLKNQKLEVTGSSGAVQALKMESDDHAVGPGVLTVNSKRRIQFDGRARRSS